MNNSEQYNNENDDKQDKNKTNNNPNLLFPHESIRSFQHEMINTIAKALEEKKHSIIHAPTGLGKTAASIAPALTKAVEEGKTVFFLTSKNTQHKIAIDTLKQVKNRHENKLSEKNIKLNAVDIVGKKWMCIQPGVSILSSNEFSEYCKGLREEHRCPYFEKIKKGENLTPEAQVALNEASIKSPIHVEEMIDIGAEHEICPYELAMLLAKQSQVIVTDYYYLFHPRIRENFLKKIEVNLEDCIIIIDEGHNLPERIKNLASANLTTNMLRRAAKEAKKFHKDQLISIFERLDALLRQVVPDDSNEGYFTRERFVNAVNNHTDYEEFRKECNLAAESIREEQKSSAIGGIGEFLKSWLGDDSGFTRIISKKRMGNDTVVQLSYRCLDPSIVAKPIIDESFSTILMSGTLTPTKMYTELLGFPPNAISKELPSPFPEENRLNLIIAKTSTKFTQRSEEQYQEIAKIVTEIINTTPGNSAIFFPSYYMKEQVDKYLNKIEKTVFHELQQMSKQEKDDTIEKFKTYKEVGAALLAVVSGSFGEGIDLPGDELKTVVIIGLPLGKPDLEIEALIKYYDAKFKNGWDYGYVFPAFNKVIQNAGRAIRSETDRGVIVFLDERFTHNRYYRCFPDTWKMKVSVNQYKEKIEQFFREN